MNDRFMCDIINTERANCSQDSSVKSQRTDNAPALRPQSFSKFEAPVQVQETRLGDTEGRTSHEAETLHEAIKVL